MGGEDKQASTVSRDVEAVFKGGCDDSPSAKKGPESSPLCCMVRCNDQGYAAKSSHPWKPRDRPHFLQLVRLTPSQKLVQLCKFIFCSTVHIYYIFMGCSNLHR